MSNDGALDMALDEVIVSNKSNRRGGRRGPSGGIQQTRQRWSIQNQKHSLLGTLIKVQNGDEKTLQGVPRVKGELNHLIVSNLHYQVSEKDLYELFGQIGKVRKAFIHLGPTGKSTGVADVIFDNSRDADRALTTYNNIELDHRPMRIAYATNPAVLTALAQQPRSQHRNAAPRGNTARGGRGGRGRGGSRRSEGQTKKSQEELDAEMDSYMQAPPSEDTAMES
ncbi:unnamed protein product [Umbelopsis vinacea]